MRKIRAFVAEFLYEIAWKIAYIDYGMDGVKALHGEGKGRLHRLEPRPKSVWLK